MSDLLQKMDSSKLARDLVAGAAFVRAASELGRGIVDPDLPVVERQFRPSELMDEAAARIRPSR